MKSYFRLALVAVALLASATLAFAQAPSGLVNKLEMQKLVAAGTPEANATVAGNTSDAVAPCPPLPASRASGRPTDTAVSLPES